MTGIEPLALLAMGVLCLAFAVPYFTTRRAPVAGVPVCMAVVGGLTWGAFRLEEMRRTYVPANSYLDLTEAVYFCAAVGLGLMAAVAATGWVSGLCLSPVARKRS